MPGGCTTDPPGVRGQELTGKAKNGMACEVATYRNSVEFRFNV